MGRLDLPDPVRDEDIHPRKTLCAIDGEVAASSPDPRLPLLQADLCWDCRDEVARQVGWTRSRQKLGQGLARWSAAGNRHVLVPHTPEARKRAAA